MLPGNNEASMIADYNFWGTTDESIIEKIIYDQNDDPNCADYISYIPYLLEPNSHIPDITPYLIEP